MVRAGSPPRFAKLMDLLEVYGFNMQSVAEPSNHDLLLPIALQPYGLRETEPDAEGVRHGPDVIEGDDYLSWRGVTVVKAEPGETQSCLWDFVALVEAPNQRVLQFVERWGLSSEHIYRPDGAGALAVETLRREALSVRSVLTTLLSTEADEVVPEAILLDLLYVVPNLDLGLETDLEAVERRLKLDPDDYRDVPDYISMPHFEAVRLERWREARRAGSGVKLQARLMAAILNSQLNSTSAAFIWDERGRRFERTARGLQSIVWSHLGALFSSEVLDAYLCDICGTPFPFDLEAFQRRPRSGKRRFCSDACRLEGKRASNRVSWSRHGSRWRPSRGTT